MVFKFLQRLGNFIKQRAGPTLSPGLTPEIKDTQQTANPGVARNLEERPSLKTAADNLHTANASSKLDFRNRLQADVESTAASGKKLDLQSFQSTAGSGISAKYKISSESQSRASKDASAVEESQPKGDPERIVAATHTIGSIHESGSKDAMKPSIAVPKSEGGIIQKIKTSEDGVGKMSDSRESTAVTKPISPVGGPAGPKSEDVRVAGTPRGIVEKESQKNESTRRDTNSSVNTLDAGRPLHRSGISTKSTSDSEIKEETIPTRVNFDPGTTRGPLNPITINERTQEKMSEGRPKGDSKPVVAATPTMGSIQDKVISGSEDAVKPARAITKTGAEITQKIKTSDESGGMVTDSHGSTTANKPIGSAGESVSLESEDVKVSKTPSGIAGMESKKDEPTKNSLNPITILERTQEQRSEGRPKGDSKPVAAAAPTLGSTHDRVISGSKDAVKPARAVKVTKAEIIQIVKTSDDSVGMVTDPRESTTANKPIDPAGESVSLESDDVKVSETPSGIAGMESKKDEPTKNSLNPITILERTQEQRSEDKGKLTDKSAEKSEDLGIPKTSKKSRSKDESKQALESAKESKKEKSPKTRSVKTKNHGTQEMKATSANEVTGERALPGEESKSEDTVTKKKQKKEPKAPKDPSKPKKTSRSSKNLEAALEDVGRTEEVTKQARGEAETSKTAKSATSKKRKVKVADPSEDVAPKTRKSAATKAKTDSKK